MNRADLVIGAGWPAKGASRDQVGQDRINTRQGPIEVGPFASFAG